MSHRVVVLALPGVVMFDLAVVQEVFAGADDMVYDVRVVAGSGGAVSTSTGLVLTGLASLEEMVSADTVLVPGYDLSTKQDDQVFERLRTAHARGARLGSICTGAFALAATGLLDGGDATTHCMDADELAARHPLIRGHPNELYVESNGIYTSAGVAAGVDLCLHLVREDRDADAAARVARRMVVPPHRAGGQGQFIEPIVTAGRSDTTALVEWILEHLEEDLSVRALARRSHLSERQFARRFLERTGQTPLRRVTHQRLLAARRLLETTDLSMDAVATRSGLGTTQNLRRRFRIALGVTPGAYRRTFRT